MTSVNEHSCQVRELYRLSCEYEASLARAIAPEEKYRLKRILMRLRDCITAIENRDN